MTTGEPLNNYGKIHAVQIVPSRNRLGWTQCNRQIKPATETATNPREVTCKVCKRRMEAKTRVAPQSQPNHTPTPEQIAAECAKYRERWTDAEEQRRIVGSQCRRIHCEPDAAPVDSRGVRSNNKVSVYDMQ